MIVRTHRTDCSSPHLLAVATLACLLSAGCAEELDEAYGRRSGPSAARSPAGTTVLAEMFTSAGHRVSTASRLSPRLMQQADVIVWFPDDFGPDSRQVAAWFDTWASYAPGRVLIYVGRDYDAVAHYWQKVQPLAPAVNQTEMKLREKDARRAHLRRKTAEFPAAPGFGTSPEIPPGWCRLLTTAPPRNVSKLYGEPRWVQGMDASKLDIQLESRIVPLLQHKVLLAANPDASDILVARCALRSGTLLLVANGSFLLNFPLVNKEHRKLAGRLIAEVGVPPRRVVFLESTHGGPPVDTKDVQQGMRTGLEILSLEPLDLVFLHLGVVGLLFCLARLPLFGRPKDLEPAQQSDFGRHVTAAGRLLERTGDAAAAAERYRYYEQHVRHDASVLGHTRPRGTRRPLRVQPAATPAGSPLPSDDPFYPT
jgi:hypothetical protein